MRNYFLIILASIFLFGCSEDIEFQKHTSVLAGYTLEPVNRLSGLANGTGKALLQFRILSEDGKPAPDIYFKPVNNDSQITSQSCTTSDKNGIISCWYTAVTSGLFTTVLSRGEQVLNFDVTFLPVINSHLTTKTTASHYLKQEEFGYQIQSGVSNTNAKESNEFGYKIITNLTF